VFDLLYQNYLECNGSLDGMALDEMVQVECLVSCMGKLYEMVHNLFGWMND
jgi:hypothetical protein